MHSYTRQQMEVSCQLRVPAALHQGKGSRQPLGRRLGGLRAGLDTVTKKNHLTCRESNTSHPDRILIIILTELRRLTRNVLQKYEIVRLQDKYFVLNALLMILLTFLMTVAIRNFLLLLLLY
jgi:hypothetical protein